MNQVEIEALAEAIARHLVPHVERIFCEAGDGVVRESQGRLLTALSDELAAAARSVDMLARQGRSDDEPRHRAARTAASANIVAAVLGDLLDRRGFRQTWDKTDDDVRKEIQDSLGDIVGVELHAAGLKALGQS